MTFQSFDTAIRSFVDSGHEVLDEGFAETGDVIIWSVDPLAPRLGDIFTIEHGGAVHEVHVYMLTTFRGGWSATCRVQG